MSTHEVTAVFENKKRARKALTHLLNQGVAKSKVHIAVPDDDYLGSMQFKLQSKISIVATTAAGIGGVVGALSANISNVSPMVSAVLGISLGVLVGGVIGSLVGAELTEQQLQELEDEDKSSFIVRVDADETEEKKVQRMLRHDGAKKVKLAS